MLLSFCSLLENHAANFVGKSSWSTFKKIHRIVDMNCRKILIYSLSMFQDTSSHKFICVCMNHSYTYAATRITPIATWRILFSAPSIKLMLNCSTFIYYQLSWVFAVIPCYKWYFKSVELSHWNEVQVLELRCELERICLHRSILFGVLGKNGWEISRAFTHRLCRYFLYLWRYNLDYTWSILVDPILCGK